MCEPRVHDRSIADWQTMPDGRHDSERRRRAGGGGHADLTQTAGSFVMPGAFRAAVSLDVSDLRCGARRRYFIEDCRRTVDAAVNQQHKQCDEP